MPYRSDSTFHRQQDPAAALRALLEDIEAGRVHIERWAYPVAGYDITRGCLEWQMDLTVVEPAHWEDA